MEAARHLRSVPNPETGEVPAGAPSYSELSELVEIQSRKLNGAWSEIAKLRKQLSEAQAVEPEAKQILDVLTFWREQCKPKAKLVVGSERWLKVRARLREKDVETKKPCYTVEDLKRAVVGAKQSDYHVKNGYLDAKTIFRDSGTVDAHIARAAPESLVEQAIRAEMRARRQALPLLIPDPSDRSCPLCGEKLHAELVGKAVRFSCTDGHGDDELKSAMSVGVMDAMAREVRASK